MNDLIDGAERIESARIADERQQLRNNINQSCTRVAHAQIRGDVALGLRLTSAKGNQHAEGEQFARR